MIRPLLFLFTLALSFVLNAQQYPQDYFRSPLDIPIVLSGTFAELRSNHFHSGIDIKTQGVEGKNVYAVADGYVSRIKISPWGYGNAVYITHPNGYTTVYGHLKSLNGRFKKYLEELQYKNKSFTIDVYLKPTDLAVKKGDIFAFSGNSGGSGGPHLHFEVRKTKNQEPINPLLFGFKVSDNRKPNILSAYLYKVNPLDLSLKAYKRIELKAQRTGEGKYYIPGIKVSGTIAFGLHTYDKLDAAENKNGVYQINQYINDTLVYSFKTEKFLFSQTRYINAHMDFDLSKSLNRKINRCFKIPGNKLNMYPVNTKNVFNVKPGKVYDVKWVVSDIHGNQSVLTTTLTGVESTKEIPLPQDGLRYNQENYLNQGGINVYFPKGSLYQSEKIAISLKPTEKYLKKFSIGKKTIGLQKHATVKVKLPDSLDVPYSKVIAVYLKNGKDPYNEGGSIENGRLKYRTRNLGAFALMIDTTAPKINSSKVVNGGKYSSNNLLKFYVSDDLSGIEKYEAYIDGDWVLLKFDPKKNLISHRIEERLEQGEHHFEIKVWDERKNFKNYSFDFTKL